MFLRSFISQLFTFFKNVQVVSVYKWVVAHNLEVSLASPPRKTWTINSKCIHLHRNGPLAARIGFHSGEAAKWLECGQNDQQNLKFNGCGMGIKNSYIGRLGQVAFSRSTGVQSGGTTHICALHSTVWAQAIPLTGTTLGTHKWAGESIEALHLGINKFNWTHVTGRCFYNTDWHASAHSSYRFPLISTDP